MDSIKHDFIFLTIFIIVVIAAFIIPQHIGQQKEDTVQINFDELDADEKISNDVPNNSSSYTLNETLIKEELVINIS